MTRYDHNQKAGNQGDVFKHPALIAAVRTLATADQPFRYADLFAGYADNPLAAQGEWQQGIGRLLSVAESRNAALEWYRQRYLQEPSGSSCSRSGYVYPGSARIVADVTAEQGSVAEMQLYDIADKPLASLRQAFPAQQVIGRAAAKTDAGLTAADFVLIDPPGLQSSRQTAYPQLTELLAMPAEQAAVLIWLPLSDPAKVAADDPCALPESGLSASEQQLLDAGYGVSRMVWGSERSTQGCVLACRMPEEARKAVRDVLDEVFELAGFGREEGTSLQHLTAG